MSENYRLLRHREKCFLLTSPFIEPGETQNWQGRELWTREVGVRSVPFLDHKEDFGSGLQLLSDGCLLHFNNRFGQWSIR